MSDSLSGTAMSFVGDDDGQLLFISRSNGITTAFTWDAAGRLTGIKDGDHADQRFSLTADGNVSQYDYTLPLEPPEAPADAEETITFDKASQISLSGYSYDQLGCRTASPVGSFTWDAAGRLTATDNATFEYNGLGDLTSRESGAAAVDYFHNYAIANRPLAAEKDTATGQPIRYYVWSPDGHLLYMIDARAANAVSYYHFDRTGSTLFLTNASGAVTDAYSYSPYGRMLSRSGSSTQPFTFAGHYGTRQEGAGRLYHMRALLRCAHRPLHLP
ncbi:hypothetical protein ACFL43_01130 [Thermodesulfobacteriota bacterium]